MKYWLNEFICTCTGEHREYDLKTLVAFYGSSFLLFLLMVMLDG